MFFTKERTLSLKIKFFFCFFLGTSLLSFGQAKYWVFLSDKDKSQKPCIAEKTRQNRKMLGLEIHQISDLPLTKSYIESVEKEGISPIHHSRWLNAFSAHLTQNQVEILQKMSFVKSVEKINNGFVLAKKYNKKPLNEPYLFKNKSKTEEEEYFDSVLEQMNASVLLGENLNGLGIDIGVVDAGFMYADTHASLIHLFEYGKIAQTRDFVQPDRPNFYEKAASYMDSHGSEVLAAIAGYNQQQHTFYGMATGSKYYLARSESSAKEYRGEEDNWIAAIEWLDSLGVRLVNTSLAYAEGFTDPKENHKINEIDGKTTPIARAATMAFKEKGMILVHAAGNEGDNKTWQVIGTPSDSEGVLAIGATTASGLKAGYSSIGPEKMQAVKPNIACFSMTGTSLAAPAITGIIACLLQKDSTLSNQKIYKLLQQSAWNYPFGNNYVGYGVPQVDVALGLMENTAKIREEKRVKANKSIELTSEVAGNAVIFHKKDAIHVLKQENSTLINQRIKLECTKKVAFTTVLLPDGQVVEIEW